mmetsp:Transcript_1635/g.2238  ORF Transcript_1635/g.2238 Transcript_1635/m.2238 type:complete len:202 (+) Transcript_1635:43-648(+)
MNAQMFITPLLVSVVQSADIDWKDPHVLLCVRAIFGASMSCMLVMLVFIYTKVNSTNDERRVKIKEKKQFGVVQEEARELTVSEHDLDVVGKNMKTLVISLCITGMMHKQYAWVLPLVIQSVHQPIAMYQSPLFQIYILGRREGGANNPLSRPWSNTPPGGIGDIWKQAQAMQEKGKEAAERKADKKKAKELNKQLARKGR